MHPALAVVLAAVLSVAANSLYRRAGLMPDEALLATGLAFGGLAVALLATARRRRSAPAGRTSGSRLAAALPPVLLSALVLALAPAVPARRTEPAPGPLGPLPKPLPPLPGTAGRPLPSLPANPTALGQPRPPLPPNPAPLAQPRPAAPGPGPASIEELLRAPPTVVPPPARLVPAACAALPRPAAGDAFAAIVADGGGAIASASLSRGTPARMGDPDDDRLGPGPDEAARVAEVAIEPGEGKVFLVAVFRTPTILAFTGAVGRLSGVVLDGGYPAGTGPARGTAPLIGATGLPRGKPVLPAGPDCLSGLATPRGPYARSDVAAGLVAAFGRRPDLLVTERGSLPAVGLPSGDRANPTADPVSGPLATDPLSLIRDDLRRRAPAGVRAVHDHDVQSAHAIVRHGARTDLSGLLDMLDTGAATLVADPVDGHLAEIRVRRQTPWPYPPGRGMRLALGRTAIVFEKGIVPSGYRWDGVCTLAEGGESLLSGRTACLWARPGGKVPPPYAGPSARAAPTPGVESSSAGLAPEASAGQEAGRYVDRDVAISPPPPRSDGFLIRPPPPERQRPLPPLPEQSLRSGF